MSKRQYSIFDTIIARISQGSVPFDAVYWIDPDQERGVSAADSVHEGRLEHSSPMDRAGVRNVRLNGPQKDLPGVEGVLTYLAPGQGRPRNYADDPPPGEPQSTRAIRRSHRDH